MTGRLRRVLVNRPGERYGAAHETEGAFYDAAVDLERARAQHDASWRCSRNRARRSSGSAARPGRTPDLHLRPGALVCDGGALAAALREADPPA
jgi:hypothetical protein